MTTRRISQFRFSFYHRHPVHCDFSGGQITSDAGLLPLRAFDERHHLTRDWAALLSDPRNDQRLCHDSLELLRQRIDQIVAGYVYNDRGECENRIEEFKNGFRADRLSCHHFMANAFRLLLHGFAYNRVNLFRLRQLPQAWRSAQIETLRARLFKIGARVRQTARCIHVHLATGWPWQSLFRELALSFNTG